MLRYDCTSAVHRPLKRPSRTSLREAIREAGRHIVMSKLLKARPSTGMLFADGLLGSYSRALLT